MCVYTRFVRILYQIELASNTDFLQRPCDSWPHFSEVLLCRSHASCFAVMSDPDVVLGKSHPDTLGTGLQKSFPPKFLRDCLLW